MNHCPHLRKGSHLLLGLVMLILAGASISGCSYKNKPVLFKTPQKIDMEDQPIKIWGSTQDSSKIREAKVVRHQRDSVAQLVTRYQNEAVGMPKAMADSLSRKADAAKALSLYLDHKADSLLVADSLSNQNYKHRIKPDDMIALRFLNNFDLAEGLSITNGQSELTFLVDREGFVYLPMLGRVKLAGMTRYEASRHLEKLYGKDFKNPSIEVYITNLYVTVMGAVKQEGNFPIVKEHTTLVEALALAGGVSELAKKRQIKVIRRMADGQTPMVIFVDLTKVESLKEEELILHDKDIVYVEPTGAKVFADRASPFLTIGSFAGSVFAIFIGIFSISRSSNP
jgi:polysaccharide biosynthesis/export protein